MASSGSPRCSCCTGTSPRGRAASTSDHGWKQLLLRHAPERSDVLREPCRASAARRRGSPSEWIKDQPWYLFLWRHDPTIQSMLVMLDAIHERFCDIDATTAWTRLTDPENPAIWFLLLPLSELGTNSDDDMRPEDLYIKMNSRGKPLTEFENFKAHFEQTIQWSSRRAEFALKRGHHAGRTSSGTCEATTISSTTSSCATWSSSPRSASGAMAGLTAPANDWDCARAAIFGEENPKREAHLDFLFAGPRRLGRANSETFDSFFGDAGDVPSGQPRVPTVLPDERRLSESRRTSSRRAADRTVRPEGGPEHLLARPDASSLYAVLLHLIEDTLEFPRRVRILRNLVEASADELRPGADAEDPR